MYDMAMLHSFWLIKNRWFRQSHVNTYSPNRVTVIDVERDSIIKVIPINNPPEL